MKLINHERISQPIKVMNRFTYWCKKFAKIIAIVDDSLNNSLIVAQLNHVLESVLYVDLVQVLANLNFKYHVGANITLFSCVCWFHDLGIRQLYFVGLLNKLGITIYYPHM